MNIQHNLIEGAVGFLKELEPDIRKALLLNKKWDDIELPISGYEGIQSAYITLVIEKTCFSLTEAVLVLSHEYFHPLVEINVLEGETQVSATRRHAEDAFTGAVRHTAANMYKSMWQDWMSGKGDVDEIIRAKLGEPKTPAETEQR